MTPRAAEMVLKQCLEWGVADAVRNIELSVSRGWRGVFPPKPGDLPVDNDIPWFMRDYKMSDAEIKRTEELLAQMSPEAVKEYYAQAPKQ